jgi:membrane protein YqaA with SNARE-associated domain
MSEPITPKRTYMTRMLEACRGPYALPAFFGVSFLESSLLPVPIDLAMIPLTLAQRSRAYLVILIGTLGSVAGALLGYIIGFAFLETLGRPLIAFYGLEASFEEFSSVYMETGWIAVLVAGITPIPFKVAAIISGAAGMNLGVFLMAALFIRFVRFSMMAGVVLLFGKAATSLMDNHSRTVSILAILLTIGGIFMVPLLLQ